MAITRIALYGYLRRELLARGGASHVYRGVHPRTGRAVALKCVREQPDTDARYLCEREREALERLAGEACAHVAHLYSAHSNKRHSTLVLKLCEGHSLEAALEGGRVLASSAAHSYARQLAAALAACARVGVVHRDVKPANIMLTRAAAGDARDGQLVLVDFGLALVLGPGSSSAWDVPFMQTRWYAAPETLAGNEHYTRAVDAWSFGCVLGEMLAGRALFRGRDMGEMRALVAAFTGAPSHAECRASTENAPHAATKHGCRHETLLTLLLGRAAPIWARAPLLGSLAGQRMERASADELCEMLAAPALAQ